MRASVCAGILCVALISTGGCSATMGAGASGVAAGAAAAGSGVMLYGMGAFDPLVDGFKNGVKKISDKFDEEEQTEPTKQE